MALWSLKSLPFQDQAQTLLSWERTFFPRGNGHERLKEGNYGDLMYNMLPFLTESVPLMLL